MTSESVGFTEMQYNVIEIAMKDFALHVIMNYSKESIEHIDMNDIFEWYIESKIIKK